ncbi:MAG TPA: glycosyltransferase family 4 protein [Pseudonocardiaceae bacterium]|nr:glycosyltransferase family 4 protein [Pseudonocardiaceae bacterium]
MSRRTRVATVVTRLQAGAGVVALRGALALDPAEYQVTLIAGPGDASGDRLREQARAGGIELITEPALCSPIAPADDLRALARLTALFRTRDFDVVHTHSAKAGTVGRIAARRGGVRRIVHTFHGFPFHDFQSGLRRGGYVQIERRLGRFTDVALCVGTGVSVEAVRRGLVAPERVRTIAVPVDRDATEATPDTRKLARRTLGVPEDGPVVGAVGRLAYQKAPEDFVAAMVALHRPDVTGVWIGGGELATKVHALADRSGVRMVFAGERADVPELLPALDVFALPSRYEGLPVAIVEAMVCGIPVVATAVNAVPDVVVPGETGVLVTPQQPEQLAAAIGYLLDRPADAARMATAARARVGARYEPRALADALMSAYTNPSAAASRTRAQESSCV